VFFFLPLGTTRPRWRTPYLTYGLIAACVLVYLAQMGSEDPFGAAFVPAHPSVTGLIASMFMHAGLVHLIGNMIFLWLFATLVEDVFGPWLLLGFYLASHVGAVVLHMLVTALFSPGALDRPIVGASGAIAGIMGLSAICFLRTKVRIWYFVWYWYFFMRRGVVEIGAPVFVGLWAAWELLQGTLTAGSGAASGTAHWAHIGGFAIGLGGALAFKLRARVVYSDLVDGRRPVTSEFEAFSQAGELEQMVERSPDNADAWYALGRAREASGRLERAGEAYSRALGLFLRERRGAQAVEAYAAMKEYQALPALPDAMLFVLACSLEDARRKKDAFGMFRHLIATGSPGPQAETVLIRAAQIAGELPGYRVHAVECYERLLKEFPYSSWCGLATERLAKLRAMPEEEQSAVEAPPPLLVEDRPPGAEQEREEPSRPVTRWDRLERRPDKRQGPEE
jgi:membrane associated rhomboid family serine protease